MGIQQIKKQGYEIALFFQRYVQRGCYWPAGVPVVEPKPLVVPLEPTLDVAGVVCVLVMLLGAPVTAEPTLEGAFVLFIVLPWLMLLEGAGCMPLEVAGTVCVVVDVTAGACVAGVVVVVVVVLEPSIAADATGVAVEVVVCVDGCTAPCVPAAPLEPTELVPPTEPELVVEPVEPALPALEPVLTATEVGLPCVLPLLVAEVLLSLPLQATKPSDNNTPANKRVVFLTMNRISNDKTLIQTPVSYTIARFGQRC